MENKREKGRQYELLAAEYLKSKGYLIIEQNFLSKTGEIDLIAKDDNTLVFCEVKYRTTEAFGLPQEAVDYKKQLKIRKTAAYYLYKNGYPEEQQVRFDVVGILKDKINHIKDAF